MYSQESAPADLPTWRNVCALVWGVVVGWVHLECCC